MGRSLLILVDTHVVVWLAFDQARLSKKAKTAIDDARKNEGGLAISAISLLELAALLKKGKFNINISLESFLQEIEERFFDYKIGILKKEMELVKGNAKETARLNKIGRAHV